MLLNKWKERLEAAFGRVVNTITNRGLTNPSTTHLKSVPPWATPKSDGFKRAESLHNAHRKTISA
ncbi:MAG TPA: hypothetical protein VLF41_02590 [Candidatus Nanoarchaeia archaeon]|nr:hypothetical protein [Candidatus Nanoarchaeia archaeon]